MSKKIFRSIMAVAMVVLVASLLLTSSFLYEYFNKLQAAGLKEELSLATISVEKIGTEYLDSCDSSLFRFTLISSNGTVLYDSHANVEEMENHSTREEVTEALKNGEGSSARFSSTLTEKTLYAATLLENGNILRLSVNQVSFGALIFSMLPVICAIVFISIAVTMVLSHRMANSIVKPLYKLDLENPDENNSYEELSPILTKLSKQHKQISRQIRELRQKSDEFKQITSSMNEGLVLLDKKGIILNINTAAKKLFGTDNSVIGHNIIAAYHSVEMLRAIENALHGKHSEFREERGGREYQFIINQTETEGKTSGAIILCFDVTETAFAERNRREFTANVSHELKTPLQSIIGSAELLENGLVKTEDTPRFIGNIKNEASRLVSLINDIIRLSQLDEDNSPASESVDLYEVATEVIEVLGTSASKKHVKLYLNGTSCVMSGIRRYLFEIIYNLCDNAIRYNKEGGSVTIDIKEDRSNVILSVSDTGIGIPAEHQSRIFERFYRVDKSHSKQTGGTGLGLSIVKHAVAYHGGSISLDSNVENGTKITVIF